MPSSESEDFESADEGTGNIEKKERKKRNSSSNYSDNALENDPSPLKAPAAIVKKVTSEEKQVYNFILTTLYTANKMFQSHCDMRNIENSKTYIAL